MGKYCISNQVWVLQVWFRNFQTNSEFPNQFQIFSNPFQYFTFQIQTFPFQNRNYTLCIRNFFIPTFYHWVRLELGFFEKIWVNCLTLFTLINHCIMSGNIMTQWRPLARYLAFYIFWKFNMPSWDSTLMR